jgi:serine protease
MKKALLALTVLILLCAPAWGEKTSPSEPAPSAAVAEHVPGEVVVDLRNNLSVRDVESFMRDHRLTLRPAGDDSREEKIEIATVDDAEIDSLVARLRQDRRVEAAEPNYIYRAYFTPNDPLLKYQWHMDTISARKAWNITAGEGVIVAIIDTGVCYKEAEGFRFLEDLRQTRFIEGYNFIEPSKPPLDDHAHGSHVAGTVAQSTNNGKGCVGVAYNCTIMPLKVLSKEGYGTVANIADAIRYAANHRAKVINMSLGGPMPSSVMEKACRDAYRKGVVIICAAGNSKSTRIGYPAAYKECVAVSAIRFDEEIAFYSNRGKDIDIAAPGGDLTVDQNDDGYKDGVLQNTIKVGDPTSEDYYLFQGTSMASPHVAGVAALVMSLGVTNPDAVTSLLKSTARPKEKDVGYGAGIVDAARAVERASYLDGAIKLGIAVLITLIVCFVSARFAPLPYWPGLIVGACGFFFLPLVLQGPVPYREFLCRGFPQWDIAILGAHGHMNPLFYSALAPAALAFLFFEVKIVKNFISGFSAGVAAHLLHAFFYAYADLLFIPGIFVLDKGWLLANGAVCIIAAYLLNLREPPKKDAVPA